MYYMYVIRYGTDGRVYCGSTGDLKRRIAEHSRKRGSVELVYYEAFSAESLACRREQSLKKHGSAWQKLKKRIGLHADTAPFRIIPG